MSDILRTRDDTQFVRRRPIPIAHLQVTATTSGAAQTLLTVQTAVMFEVKHLAACNRTGTAATLTLHAVPSGGSLGNANAELVGYSVVANTSVDLTDLIGQLYTDGMTLEAFSDTNGALVLHGHGEEIA